MTPGSYFPRMQHLRHYRVLRGYSQLDLAARARISDRTVLKIERGKRKTILLDTAYRLSEVLGVPVEVLFPPDPHDRRQH